MNSPLKPMVRAKEKGTKNIETHLMISSLNLTSEDKLKDTLSAYDQLEAEIKELKSSQLTLLEEISRLTAETANSRSKKLTSRSLIATLMINQKNL